jgi:hypothetical protein
MRARETTSRFAGLVAAIRSDSNIKRVRGFQLADADLSAREPRRLVAGGEDNPLPAPLCFLGPLVDPP